MIFRQDAPSFERDGHDWPNRNASRFVAAGGLRWHYQRYFAPPVTTDETKAAPADADAPQAGARPKMLLLHGTGAATHSWRDLGPLLGRDFDCLAPDLPGHGFTGMPTMDGLSLEGMARLVGDFLRVVAFRPDIVIGHSAGAAVALAMVAKDLMRPKLVMSINGALRPMRGNTVFSPLAKLLFINPLTPKLFAWRAVSPDATARIIASTGSHIEPRGTALYARLFQRSGHVAGALGMMANWHLEWLARRFGSVDVPVVLITAAGDRAVPPGDADKTVRALPKGSVRHLPQGGHLVHEEDPAAIAALIGELALAGVQK